MLAGVDEAGRGPLVGPVVAAAVIWPEVIKYPEIRDSKKLTAKKREHLYTIITKEAISYGIGSASAVEIDKYNILQATMLAMQRAVACLKVKPSEVWVDGNKAPDLGKIAVKAIIGGDNSSPLIAAASIIAKVYRDRQLLLLDAKYPQYGFKSHKGYPTKGHLINLRRYGPLPNQYRYSFRPVASLIN